MKVFQYNLFSKIQPSASSLVVVVVVVVAITVSLNNLYDVGLLCNDQPSFAASQVSALDLT